MTEPLPSGVTAATLSQLLDDGRVYASEYRGGLSNHLPMALTALQRLGAGDARLRAFAARSATRLVRIDTAAPELDGAHTLRGEIAARGAGAVLADTLPGLMPGVGAAAFHGLIRSAYAVDAGHDGELAAGLTYWQRRHLPLRAQALVAGPREVEAWADAIERRVVLPPAREALITGALARVAASTAFAESVDGLRLDADTLRHLSAYAAERYLRTRNFTVLHLITSAHALRLLQPWCGDAALGWYALAFGAGLVASRSGGRDAAAAAADTPNRPATAGTPDWPALTQRAIASDDDHVIKLVYTCRAEAAHYRDDDRYRRVAALAVSGG